MMLSIKTTKIFGLAIGIFFFMNLACCGFLYAEIFDPFDSIDLEEAQENLEAEEVQEAQEAQEGQETQEGIPSGEPMKTIDIGEKEKGVVSDAIDSLEAKEINMVVGELNSLKTYSLTRISLTDPGVADIVNIENDTLLLLAKSVGQAALFIWDEHGKRVILIYVYSQDLDFIKERLSQLFEAAGITEVSMGINKKEGKIVISGDVPEHKKEHYEQLVGPFAAQIIDLAQDEEVNDLIEVDMQISELSTTLSRAMGVDWGTSGGSSLSLAYPETMPPFDGTPSDFFKIGDFQRTTALLATVEAILEEGKGRILSKPRLVVVSGEEASFLVGGEIPIRTTTTTDTGATQENVEFKEYGITMTITPTIKKGKIDVDLNVEVSEVDASTASSVSETVAFATRSASTRLYLNNKQTVVLAGLIKQKESETIKKVPFLGDIPILGLMFRHRGNAVADQDQELVISLTPTILSSVEEAPQAALETKAPIETTAPVIQETALPSEETESKEEIPAEAEETSVLQESGQESLEESQVEEDEDIVSTEPQEEFLETEKRDEVVVQTQPEEDVPQYAGIPIEMSRYVYAVQKKIAQAINYPKEAEKHGWEGTVKLGLLILKDGSLAFASVRESSGYDIFDQYALDTAKNIAPYSGFPSDTDLQELNVTIPITYKLEKR